MTKKAKAAIEKRIERAYYAGCSGVQLSILDIPRVFAAGEALIASAPTVTDAELVPAIRAIVDGINQGRKAA